MKSPRLQLQFHARVTERTRQDAVSKPCYASIRVIGRQRHGLGLIGYLADMVDPLVLIFGQVAFENRHVLLVDHSLLELR